MTVWNQHPVSNRQRMLPPWVYLRRELSATARCAGQSREPRGPLIQGAALLAEFYHLKIPKAGIFPTLTSYNLDQEKQEILVMGENRGTGNKP